jgi:hypothetical protein
MVMAASSRIVFGSAMALARRGRTRGLVSSCTVSHLVGEMFGHGPSNGVRAGLMIGADYHHAGRTGDKNVNIGNARQP